MKGAGWAAPIYILAIILLFSVVAVRNDRFATRCADRGGHVDRAGYSSLCLASDGRVLEAR